MASTAKKKIEKKDESSLKGSEFLHADHLRLLETMSRDVELSRVHIAVEEQGYRNLILEFELLKNRLEKQKLLVQQKADHADTISKRFTQFKKDLWPQYGLEESAGLGYDVETGKIHKQ
jgi:hypothetical protein